MTTTKNHPNEPDTPIDADPFANDPDLLVELSEPADPYGDRWDSQHETAVPELTVEVNNSVTLWGLVALEAIVAVVTLLVGQPIIGLIICVPLMLMAFSVYRSSNPTSDNRRVLPPWIIALTVIGAVLVVLLLSGVRTPPIGFLTNSAPIGLSR